MELRFEVRYLLRGLTAEVYDLRKMKMVFAKASTVLVNLKFLVSLHL